MDVLTMIANKYIIIKGKAVLKECIDLTNQSVS
ncbi:MAG: hypothetical protein K0S93_157 [Nitrososphaeraceae archaeon]|jgi:hypothetical protein|nr:hypothetical protein [Nitrososphaeraceae archaeon]